MTTYDNDYNRSLARQQRLYDYAQIANDKHEATEDVALNGGRRKPRRKISDDDLKDMDVSVFGKGVATMEGEGLKEDFDDALDWVADKADKLGKIVKTGSDIADAFSGKRKGYGLSGGDMYGGVRRGAELADMINPSGSPYIPGIQQPHSIVHAVGGASARARAQNYKMPGLNVVGSDFRMKGDNFSANPHQIQAEQAKDGFIGNGMSGGDFFSDLGNIAQSVAPFLPLLGLGRKADNLTFRGGDFFSDLGNIAQSVAPFLPLLGLGKNVKKGSKKAREFIALVRKMKARVSGAGLGSGYSGGMTHEQDMNMADAMGDIFSGEGRKKQGKQSRENERLAMKIAELKGRGAGQYDMPELLGLEGQGFFDDLLSGISKVGDTVSALAPHVETGMKLYDKFGKKGKGMSGGADPDLGQIASMFGLGMSGGADYGSEEEGVSEPLAMAFLGGRHPSKVSKAEKKMLFLKALADAKLHQELAKQMRGRGASGGALMRGLGLSGGDFWSDFGDGFVKGFTGTAQLASKLLPFLGAGESGGGLSGGGINDYDNSSTAGQFSYGQMGNTAGKANGGVGGSRPMQAFGRPKVRDPPHHLLLKPQMKGCSLSGFGQDTDRPVGGAKRSAPAGGWIAHVKAYAKQHGCSYKEALSRAGATYHKQK